MANQCSFAHGRHELRVKTHVGQQYRTKECKQYNEFGMCTYGPRCQYLHNQLKYSSRLDSHLDKILARSGLGAKETLSEALLRVGRSSFGLTVFARLRDCPI